jgi:hypothetical protein
MTIARHALEAGLAVPRIDNITASARQQAQAPPVRWNRTTWLYRGEDGMRCAEAARAWLASAEGLRRESQLVELPAALRAPPGVIELWLPSSPPPAK